MYVIAAPELIARRCDGEARQSSPRISTYVMQQRETSSMC